jgi:hypothetical protein
MALDRFKNIDEVINEGTSITKEISDVDLKLIDRGFIPTPFDIGNNDVLEFVLYDSANNVLEQLNYGNIRYMDANQMDAYLIKSENILDKQQGGGYLIDVKKLITDAGYNIGIFRVQFNFVNNRVGSDIERDRMWIHEISPTRTEIRLLPFNNFNESDPLELDIKRDLNQSYDSFTMGKFSGDEVYYEIDEIINRLTVAELIDTFKTIKSQSYLDNIQSEFGIINYDQFFANVLESMKQAVRHTLLHKNSTIGSDLFGKPLGDGVDFAYYNKRDIVTLLNDKFTEAVDYHLPKRTLLNEVLIDKKTQESIDELVKLIQRLDSDVNNTNAKAIPNSVTPPTFGEIKESFTYTPITVTPVSPAVEPIQIIVPTPAPEPTPPAAQPPIASGPDSYSPNNLDNVFDALFEQEGRGKTGVGDSRQVVAGGPRQQQNAVE